MSAWLDSLPMGTVITIVGLGLLASVVAAMVTAWSTVDRRRHGPTIRRLSREMGLGRRDLLLLDRVARVAGRAHAGSLLISRGCFDHAARGFVHRHGQAARLRSIRSSLFDA